MSQVKQQSRRQRIKHYLSKLIHHGPEMVSLRLCEVRYDPRTKAALCKMQLCGKNVFPTYTSEEILNSSSKLQSISATDAVIITRFDEHCRQKRQQAIVLEIRRNGTALLQFNGGEKRCIALNLLCNDPQTLQQLSPEDAYQLGFTHGRQTR